MSRKSRRNEVPAHLRVPPAEQLMIDSLPDLSGPRVLSMTLGRGQFAVAAARDTSRQVTLHEFDIYLAEQARKFIDEELGEGRGALQWESSLASYAADRPGEIRIQCAADFAEEEFDIAAVPVDPRGEAELTRELLQTAYLRLRIGGRLCAATSNNEDQWLHDELRKLFSKVTRRPERSGVLYLATKEGPLKKEKLFADEFAFRDRERLIKAISRPGVFNHRRLDGGARALINTMQVGEGFRVLDLGCGSGTVALAAAFAAPHVQVVAIDSHARAISCTKQGAAMNGLENMKAILNAEGDTGEPGTFDLVLGNPPYYSDYRIAGIFLEAARKALKPGGTVLIVSKAAEWYVENMPVMFPTFKRHIHKLYSVFEAKTAAP